MVSITLAQAAPLTQDLLIRGIIANVITVDRFYEMLPFMGISGSAISFNRELVLGDAQGAAVGDTITAKNAATVTNVTAALKSILADVEINNLIASTQSNINDQVGLQIASKAKSVGRTYANWLINGTNSTSQFDGLLNLVDVSQTIGETAVDGDVLTFEILDELMDTVTDKDGQVDFLVMNSREQRKYLSLLRALGGAAISETYTLPSGAQVPQYRGTPIFRNDWCPINQTVGATTTAASIIAGNLDDGSQSVGISGLTAENNFGMSVEDVGLHQSKDEHIYRVKMYGGLAMFSAKGLAVRTGIKAG